MWVLETSDVEVTGPVKRFRSSSFAERAWCDQCGTQLWIKDDDGNHEVMPGLFDQAQDLPLSHEVFVDQAFACVALAGDHPRLTAAEYQASGSKVAGDTQ